MSPEKFNRDGQAFSGAASSTFIYNHERTYFSSEVGEGIKSTVIYEFDQSTASQNVQIGFFHCMVV